MDNISNEGEHDSQKQDVEIQESSDSATTKIKNEEGIHLVDELNCYKNLEATKEDSEMGKRQRLLTKMILNLELSVITELKILLNYKMRLIMIMMQNQYKSEGEVNTGKMEEEEGKQETKLFLPEKERNTSRSLHPLISMINTIFWNIRGKIDGYGKFLGFQHCIANTNGKIWCFWKYLDQAVIIANDDQQISINFKQYDDDIGTCIMSVYAKCIALERKLLWDSVEDISNLFNGPWCIGSDFNVIMDPEEKLGGRPHRASRSLDFISTMKACGLTDIGYIGPIFTWCNNSWCNNKRPNKRIWKRLDRILVNNKWSQNLQYNVVKHLVKTGFDHRPLLMKIHNDQPSSIKYFRFLNFWTNQEGFHEIVQETWNMQVEGNAMWKLQCKLKALSKKLSNWSRNIIGDVNEKVSSWEAKVHILEELDIINNNEQGREELNKVHVEYIRWLIMQESLLRQKAQIKWFQESEYNSKYFHSVFRGIRKKLQLYRIKNHIGRWIQGEEKISKAVVRHFEKLFNLKQSTGNSRLLDCIPSIVTDEDNVALTRLPDEKEIKDAIFSMSSDSSAGPNGYNGKFFQCCWKIIKQDSWIEIIEILISEVWCSIIINGSRKGFFTSSQGLKQGDPLSPSLFILAAEVLSRSLNKLHTNENFIPFSMSCRGPQVNHLAYADDIVIFSSGNTKSVNLIMKQIKNYEKASGQKVNDNKNFFLTSPRTSAFRINRLRCCTRFIEKSFPFTYLGCPLYIGRKRISYFDGMVTKVVKKLSG
ncbi:uncharacterized protein LOC142178420 [Nicotiana tabacum]|uniref:Uncharacterized protein LOC142178420 n=1 Tax=Nicotiana tabacum TaxID=4097 RepID=A0AC58U350_TOBAC